MGAKPERSQHLAGTVTLERNQMKDPLWHHRQGSFPHIHIRFMKSEACSWTERLTLFQGDTDYWNETLLEWIFHNMVPLSEIVKLVKAKMKLKSSVNRKSWSVTPGWWTTGQTLNYNVGQQRHCSQTAALLILQTGSWRLEWALHTRCAGRAASAQSVFCSDCC